MGIEVKRSGKYLARLEYKGYRKSVGTYATWEEAKDALKLARAEIDKQYEPVELLEKSARELVTSNNPSNDASLAGYISSLATLEAERKERKLARSVSVGMARDLLFVRQFAAKAREVLRGKIVPKGYARKTAKKDLRRCVSLMLSDLHFGAALGQGDCPVTSDAHTEVRRLAKVVTECCDFKIQYRNNTHCNVLLAGDLFEGFLKHDLRSGEPLTDQFTALLYALMQAISHIAAAYPSVTVYSTPGNHDRLIERHPGRAVHHKWDSYATMLAVALKLSCQQLKNVQFVIPRTPYCVVPLFDNKMFVTHGDGVINVGNPGSSLNVRRIESQIAKMNATRIYGHEFKVVAVGHVHIGVSLALPEAHLIVNPPLVPTTPYALNIGSYSTCGQMMWESTAEYPVGDVRLIRVGPQEDSNSDLESVIKPTRFSHDP